MQNMCSGGKSMSNTGKGESLNDQRISTNLKRQVSKNFPLKNSISNRRVIESG